MRLLFLLYGATLGFSLLAMTVEGISKFETQAARLTIDSDTVLLASLLDKGPSTFSSSRFVISLRKLGSTSLAEVSLVSHKEITLAHLSSDRILTLTRMGSGESVEADCGQNGQTEEG